MSQTNSPAPFRQRSKTSSTAQLAGIKSAVEVLSAARLASSQDATKDRSSLLHISTYTPPTKDKKIPKTERRATLGKGLRSLLKREPTPPSSPGTSTDSNQSKFFITQLQKNSLKDIKFDLFITQIQNAQLSWLSSFTSSNGCELLLNHLIEENYTDQVKDKFLPCLRCFHSIVKRTEEAKLGTLVDAESFKNIIHILVWTTDLFLLSSTCMTLLDISRSLYGHLHLMEALSRAKLDRNYSHATFPFICALRLLKARNSDNKGVRICSVGDFHIFEVVVTLINSFVMGIHDIQQRFICENEMLAQGILPLLLDLHSFGNIEGQLDLFEQTLTSDYNQMAQQLGAKPLTQNRSGENILKVKLVQPLELVEIALSYANDITLQQLLEVIVVKQEYLGYETHPVEKYALFVDGAPEEDRFVPLIGRFKLPGHLMVAELSLESYPHVYLQILPFTIEITDLFHSKTLSLSVTPYTTFDTIIRVIIGTETEKNEISKICEFLDSCRPDSPFEVDIEYGIFSDHEAYWMPSSTPLISMKMESKEFFLAAKIPPLTIRWKEQSFNLELRTNDIPVSSVLKTVSEKFEIPNEQKFRYSLFLDDGHLHEDEPAFGMLGNDEIISDILKSNNIECLTLILGIRPLPLKILISDASLVDRNSPSSFEVLVLLNRTVSEGLDSICKQTGHVASEQQLETLKGEKLADNKTFETQQIKENSELILTPLTPDVTDGMANDVNIWEEPENKETIQTEIENGNLLVVAATLNQLVRKATDEDKYDSNFLETFLATYRSFTTPSMLLEKLKQRYYVPDQVPEQKKQVVQMRVCVVMKRWVGTFNDEIEFELLDKINAWIESESKAGQKILSGIKSAITKKKQNTDQQFYFKTKPPIPYLPKEKTLESIKFDELNMLEVARQLTLVEFDMFHKIRPVELFGQAWSRPKMQHLCPNLMNLINHFNYISRAVASMIAQEPKVRQRAKIYEKLILLAEHLKNINSFNLLIAVVSGMNNSGVGRLKWTKARVPQRSMLILESLEELTSMQNSYKNYRNLITVNSEPPLIPYMGVYLQDLTFIEDGNPDQIEELINFSKRILVRKILSQVATFQQEAFNFVTVPLVRAYLDSLPQLDDDQIYKLSLQCEPRSAQQRSDIE